MLVENRLRLLERRALGDRDEIRPRHPLRDREIDAGLEAQVAVRENPEELPVRIGDGNSGDPVARHQLERFGDPLLRAHRDRIDDHAALRALDLVDLARLLLDGEVLVNDPDAAHLRHRDRQARLGDGVHRGRDERDVERDPARQARLRFDLGREDLGGGRQQ